tara:strand:- start:311 stop:502 length:192 start_codon:yes stop_codon:yes gene_type:complete
VRFLAAGLSNLCYETENNLILIAFFPFPGQWPPPHQAVSALSAIASRNLLPIKQQQKLVATRQ